MRQPAPVELVRNLHIKLDDEGLYIEADGVEYSLDAMRAKLVIESNVSALGGYAVRKEHD